MSKIYDSVDQLIGNTPLVKLNRLVEPGMADVYLKLESLNPAGSIKDRIALAMVEKAEQEGKLTPGGRLWSQLQETPGLAWRWWRPLRAITW